MNFWISSKQQELRQVIKKANLVIMNEGEARQLFDTPNLIKAGKAMLELGPQFAIIKKGEHGALLFSDGNFFSAPGYPLENVCDPTGAGDSFAGGLMGYLAKTNDITESNLRKAVIYGSTIASFCAENFGAGYLDTITIDKIEERYKAFEQIRKF
jgi:ribokinase